MKVEKVEKISVFLKNYAKKRMLSLLQRQAGSSTWHTIESSMFRDGENAQNIYWHDR